jgi:hypothetical protein
MIKDWPIHGGRFRNTMPDWATKPRRVKGATIAAEKIRPHITMRERV